MKRNVGNNDRLIRVAVLAPAFVIAALFVGAGSIPGIVLFALAGVMVGTGVVGFCPLYALVGIDTCPAPGRLVRR
jgi:hypothetical protein